MDATGNFARIFCMEKEAGFECLGFCADFLEFCTNDTLKIVRAWQADTPAGISRRIDTT
jgi:hypothetical protein